MKQESQLDILHQGRGWVAIAKPPGMSVHNDPNHAVDAVSLVREWLINQKLANPQTVISPVHRLDRETSGVLILAWERTVASRLQVTFEERKIRKVYRTVVRGVFKNIKSDGSGSGLWNRPLTDRAEGRKNPAGRADERVSCETKYKVLRANDFVTELEIDLGSGRQHQIRKHASLDHHAVVGDTRYGDPKHAERIRKIFGINRLLLHALSLELADPETGHTLNLSAKLPAEFEIIFERLPEPKFEKVESPVEKISSTSN